MKCPQCKNELKKVVFDIGYGIDVESHHCEKCGHNITEGNRLESALATLRRQMTKQVKVVKVGTGLGVRFPNDVVKSLNLKKGKEMLLTPDNEGLKLVMEG